MCMFARAGEAFAVARDGGRSRGTDRAAAAACAEAWSRWRRPAASRRSWRPPWRRPACRWWWSIRRRCAPSPRRSASAPRPIRSMRRDRPLRRGDQAGVRAAARRGDPAARRSRRPAPPDHPDDRRRAAAREARSARVEEEHRPAAQGPARRSSPSSTATSTTRSRLAGLA